MLRSPLTWGVTALVFAVIFGLVLTYLYVNPPGKGQLVSFYTDDANSVRTGDEVRMAGVKPINESLNQIQTGLSGTNVQVVAATIDAGNALMSTVERQRGQVTKILNLTDEYVGALNGYKENLAVLVRKLSITTQTLEIYDRGFSATLQGLGDVLQALRPLGDFYDGHKEEFIERVQDFLYRGRLFVERNGLTIRVLKRTQNLFDRVLDAQSAPAGLLATDLCVPIPGSAC